MMPSSDSEIIKEQVHCVKTFKEFFERLQEHEISTSSKFVLIKSCKKFTQERAILSEKLKLHWENEIPYFHFGARLYLCHQGRDNNKYQKKKYATNRDKKADTSEVKKYNLTKVTKKLNCPAFIKVTRLIKILEHKVSDPITNHRKGVISNLIKKQILESKDIGEECYVFNLPSVEDHKFHLFGSNASAIEPIDIRVKEYVMDLVHRGEKDLASISKKLIMFVENELDEHDRTRRRFYPDNNSLRKFICRVRNNMDRHIVSQMSSFPLPKSEVGSASQSPQSESNETVMTDCLNVNLGETSKNILLRECNQSIQSILSTLETLDEVNLQNLSRSLKDLYNNISCQAQRNNVIELNPALKSSSIIESRSLLTYNNSNIIPNGDLEDSCVVQLTPELISNSLMQVTSELPNNYMNHSVGDLR